MREAQTVCLLENVKVTVDTTNYDNIYELHEKELESQKQARGVPYGPDWNEKKCTLERIRSEI